MLAWPGTGAYRHYPSRERSLIARRHYPAGIPKALSGLEGDPEQLEELIHIVEKAIFDSAVSAQEVQASTSRAGKLKDSAGKADTEPSSLMVTAGETVRGRRRRRVAVSSDLALIIDARLQTWSGLHREDTDTPDSVQPKEVREGDDDENREPPDGHALAKLCRGKLNRLFSRMVKQMELAVENKSSATTPLIQLAAVLGIVKHLRLRQSSFPWLPRGEEVVDYEKAWNFFKNVCRLLYSTKGNLAARGLEENAGGEFDELTIIRGLLTWLAFDCDLDVRTALAELRDDPEEAAENLIGLAFLLPLATDRAHDEQAKELLLRMVDEQRRKPGLAQYHLNWARSAEASAKRATEPSKDFRRGDLAVPVKMSARWPLVVAAVEHNKVGVVDIETGELKLFANGFLARVAQFSGAG